MGEDAEKPLSILIIDEDLLALVAAGGDVIEGAGKFDTQRAGHLSYPQ
jgi:hypothetical protein